MIHVLKQTDLRLSDAPLPFEEKHKAHIDVFWEQAFALSPRLWNGHFFMFSDVEIKEGALTGQAHKTDFATFLYWRDKVFDDDTVHITGTTFPVLDGGSLLAVRMSKHTANGGRIYFPAGSFDIADAIDGRLDPVVNFTREMQEEVGIEVMPDWLTGPMLAAQAGNCLHITRKVCLPYSFEQVEKIWQTHRKNGGDDEIDGLVQISSPMHIPTQMPGFAREFCQYHFKPDEAVDQ